MAVFSQIFHLDDGRHPTGLVIDHDQIEAQIEAAVMP